MSNTVLVGTPRRVSMTVTGSPKARPPAVQEIARRIAAERSELWVNPRIATSNHHLRPCLSQQVHLFFSVPTLHAGTAEGVQVESHSIQPEPYRVMQGFRRPLAL